MKKKLRLVVSLLTFFLLSSALYSQGGDNAAAAAASPISLPFSAVGTTCGHVDNYNPLGPYGITPDGKDWLYYFCAPTSGVIDVFMSTPYGSPPAIMVYSTTPNASGQNWDFTSFTGANYMNSLVSFTATAGTCYYVMIDNYPTTTFTETCINYSLNIQYHQNQPAAPLQPACSNIGYDAGNLSGWVGTTGVVNVGAAGAPTPQYTPLYYTTTAQQHSVTSGAGVDPYGGFPIVNPSGGTNSLRLGDFGTFGTTGQFYGGIPGACGATLEQKFTVTASNALFVYYYAVVIQDAGSDHTNQEQPFFKTDVFDCAGNAVACGQYLVTGGPGIPGFTLAGLGSNVYYKNWSPVAVDLTPYIGTCVTVRYTVGDCTRGAHFAYAYIDADCSPLAITGINKVCPTKSTTLTAPTGLFSYSWTPGGQTTQSVSVSPTTTTTYSCELTSYTNCKTYLTYSVSLYPAVVASANSQTVCNGTAASITSTVNNTGGTYSWNPGGASGSGLSVSPAVTTSYTCTYTDLNGCQDTAMARVTVNPLPVMSVPPNVTVCNSATIAASSFTSSVASATYSWTNSNTSIGLAASGSGNTPVFTGTNAGTTPATAIISVTPTANSCTGLPVTYTITVNPIPNVNAITSNTYCSGATVPAIPFSGNVTGTVFNWNNTNTSIGLGASGAGNIPSFTSTNATAGIQQGVVTVTPTANTCVGAPTNFTISVNPTPNVNAVTSNTYCSGATVPVTTFTGNVTGTTFNWSNTNTSIGLGASGTGNTPSFTSINTTASSQTGVVTVTPTALTCTGTPTSFTISVNPIPNVNAVASATYCNGVTVPATVFTGNVTGTIFSWNNTNTTIGLGASGNGNTPSFTAANITTGSQTAVVSVTPTALTCTGTPTSYTILVNPSPNVNAVTSNTYCSGVAVPTTTFTGNITGTSFNWNNTNTTIGLGASGIGNTPSFTSTNTTTGLQAAVVTVTPTANSCIGTPINFTISVNPVPAAPTVANVTVCPGSSGTLTATAPGGTYTWYDALVAGNLLTTGATYATPGLNTTTTYYVKTTNAFGCISPLTPATVTVLNFLPVSASANQTICIGANATLSVSPNGAGYVYSWDAPGTPAFSTIYNPLVTPATTTNYSVTVTSPNGCTGTAQTKVFVNPLPVANTGAAIAFCSGQSGSIGATSTAGYTYSWLPATGLSSTTISNPTVVLQNTGTTAAISSYTLNVTLNGCNASNTVQVTVNPLPVSNPGSSIILCTGQTGVIGAAGTAGYTYAWSPATNLSSSTASNPTVTGVNNGSTPLSVVYTVTTGITATGCSSAGQVTVGVLPLTTVNAGSVASLCEGAGNIVLNGTVGGSSNSGLWSGGAGSFSPANSSLNASYNPTASEYANGSVTLTLTAIATAPCQNVNSTVTIIFYKNPVIAYIVDNPKGCPEHCVTFTDKSTIANPDVIQNWTWNFGDGGSSNLQNPSHCYENSGLYTVTLTATSNHGCTSQSVTPQMIEVYPMPVASFIPTPVKAGILDPNITFQNTSQGGSTYFWNFGDQYSSGINNTSTLVNPSHAYTNSGTYAVNLIVTSIHGCVAQAIVNVEIEPEFTFYIPNAFTPGNDNVNDVFTGMGIGIEKYEMWIFDRWGANIYYSDGITKGWNGTMNGKSKEVQQDVYVWKVKIKDVFDKTHNYVGHVTLLR